MRWAVLHSAHIDEARHSTRKYCAFFDVDHTLMRGSTGSALGRALFRANIVGWRDFAAVIRWNLLYAAGRMDEIEIWRRSVERLLGKLEAPIRKACQDAHPTMVRPRLYREAEAAVAQHRDEGAHLVIISAGPRYSVLEIARELSIDRVSTSWANIVDGKVHDLEGVEIPFGPMKRTYAERHCAELGVDPKDCWAYGDSRSDVEMLELVGHPVAVNPKPALRRVAESRGWPIVRWTATRGDSGGT